MLVREFVTLLCDKWVNSLKNAEAREEVFRAAQNGYADSSTSVRLAALSCPKKISQSRPGEREEICNVVKTARTDEVAEILLDAIHLLNDLAQDMPQKRGELIDLFLDVCTDEDPIVRRVARRYLDRLLSEIS